MISCVRRPKNCERGFRPKVLGVVCVFAELLCVLSSFKNPTLSNDHIAAGVLLQTSGFDDKTVNEAFATLREVASMVRRTGLYLLNLMCV